MHNDTVAHSVFAERTEKYIVGVLSTQQIPENTLIFNFFFLCTNEDRILWLSAVFLSRHSVSSQGFF